MSEPRPEDCLGPTYYIESEAKEIAALAASLVQPTPGETATALFNWVRDEVRYDPWTAWEPPESYRATLILEKRRGYCIMKAVLLAAMTRAAGIPTRLGFADVLNHKIPESMLKLMGTNLFVFHGFVELWLDGKWLKATPAFDREATRRAGALLVELDGQQDAMLHPVDPEGHPYIEYVRSRGSYADLPVEEIREVFAEVYGKSIQTG
jgi:transglutaminase-like putative cysteine protease